MLLVDNRKEDYFFDRRKGEEISCYRYWKRPFAMAEEFQLGGGNWWENNTSTSSRNRFDSGSISSTPTTSTSATTTNYSSNWPTQTDHDEDIKPRTFLNSVSVSQSSNHDGRGGGGDGDGGGVLSSHDPNFQIMGLGLTSHQPHEWNHQSLL